MPSTLIFFHGTSRIGMEFARPGQFSFETAKLTRMQNGRATKGRSTERATGDEESIAE
jgi:hypothetical protein